MTRDRSVKNHEDYVRRVRAKMGQHIIVTHRPRAKERPPRQRKRRSYPISVKTWRRALVFMLLDAGVSEVRKISARLGTDPTSVAQSICELKRLGALPSQIGRTPIKAKR